jgi:hypothetical protein
MYGVSKSLNEKLRIHTITSSPESVSTAYICNEIAIKFVELGKVFYLDHNATFQFHQ